MRLIFVCVIAYVLGNLSSSYIVGKIFGHIDIRQHGSGNAGATNTLRVLGAKPAILALLGDIMKGVIAVFIGRVFVGINGALLSAVFVIVGHIWPAFLGFKGGKGIATALGTMLVMQPFITLICAVVALTIMYVTKYVSLGSIIGVSLFTVITIVTLQPIQYIIFGVVITALVLYTHRENIKRLREGTEGKLGQKSSKVK